jgi:predicted outer membrane repeat protein
MFESNQQVLSTHGEGGEEGEGSAVALQGITFAITDSVFRDHAARYGLGGALLVAAARGSIRDSQFVNNTAEYGGSVAIVELTHGAELSEDSPLPTSSVSFESCGIRASQATENGGGVYVAARGVAFSDCHVDANFARGRGGGIFLDLSHVSASGLLLSNNEAGSGGGVAISGSSAALSMMKGQIVGNQAQFGGGFWVSSAQLVLEDSNISHNQATRGRGGGFLLEGGATVEAAASLIHQNTALSAAVSSDADTSGCGGGVSMLSGEFHASDCTISHNVADGCSGGGLSMIQGYFDLTNCFVHDNNASSNSPDAGVFGGGVYIGQADVHLDGGLIANTTCSGSGGGIYWAGSESVSTLFTGVQIIGNEARESGGGVFVQGSSLLPHILFLQHVIISDNRARLGGGVYTGSVVLDLLNVTVYGNLAENSGGGLLLDVPSHPTAIGLQVRGSSIIGNQAQTGAGVVLNNPADVRFYRSQVSRNEAVLDGGGLLLIRESTLWFIASTASANSIREEGNGGFFAAYSPRLLVFKDSSVQSNTGYQGGAGYILNGGTIVWSNTSCVENIAASAGACLYADGGVRLEANQSDFTGNMASGGGALSFTRSTVIGVSCSFSGNDAANKNGGAVYVEASDFSCEDCVFNGNTALLGRGGAFSSFGGASVHLARSVFEENRAVDGGAVSVFNFLQLRITHSIFNNNGVSRYGGAIDLFGSSLAAEISDSTFLANQAMTSGGAIYSEEAQLTFTECIWANNTCQMRGGGALAAHGPAAVVLTGVVATGNQAAEGGAFLGTHIDVSIDGGVIAENVARVEGGGVYLQDSNAQFSHLQFQANSATEGDGGANWLSRSSTVFSSCEFTSNSAPNGGGGVFFWDETPPTVDFSEIRRAKRTLPRNATLSIVEPSSTENNTASYGDVFATPPGAIRVAVAMIEQVSGREFSPAPLIQLVDLHDQVVTSSHDVQVEAGVVSAAPLVSSTTDFVMSGGQVALEGFGASGVPGQPFSVHVTLPQMSGIEGLHIPVLFRYCGDGEEMGQNGLDCHLCQPGTYNTANRSFEGQRCLKCPTGTHQPDHGQDHCEDCAAGTYSSQQGAEVCSECQSGWIAQEARASKCLPCAADATSNENCTECKCDIGFYGTHTNTPNTNESKFDETLVCAECETGSICRTLGVNVLDLELEDGFWRSSQSSSALLTCPFEGCLVGKTYGLGTSNCETGHSGVLCAVCETDYALDVTGSCTKCESTDTLAVVALFGMLIGMIAAIVLFVRVVKKIIEACSARKERDPETDALGRLNAKARDRLIRRVDAWRVRRPGLNLDLQEDIETAATDGDMDEGHLSLESFRRIRKLLQMFENAGGNMKLRIVTGFLQLLTQFKDILSIDWPASFSKFLASLAFVNFDILSFGPFACVFQSNHFHKLLFTTLLPVGLSGLILLAHVSMSRVHQGNREEQFKWKVQLFSLWMLMLNLAYPNINSVTMKTFVCLELDTGESFLKADLSLACDDAAYSFYYNWALGSVFCFSLGIPALFFSLLYNNRGQIYPHDPVSGEPMDMMTVCESRRENPAIMHLQFLYDHYEPRYYWWECVELLRKFMLTGLLVFFAPSEPISGIDGSATQTVMGLFICVIFLVLYSFCQPYMESSDDVVMVGTEYQLFLMLLLGLLLQVDAVTVEVNETWGPGTMDSVLLATTIAILALPVCIVFYESFYLSYVAYRQETTMMAEGFEDLVVKSDEKSADPTAEDEVQDMASGDEVRMLGHVYDEVTLSGSCICKA